MELVILGKAISIILIFMSGIILTLGIGFFIKEKQGGSIRIQLLTYSVSAALWAFCYGCIGFSNNMNVVYMLRRFGALGIITFILVDYYVVAKISRIEESLLKILNCIFTIASIVDLILFSQPDVDEFYVVNNYMTWKYSHNFARAYHNMLFIVLFIVMAMLGIRAYKIYEYKRQKRFMLCFYIANIVLFISGALDTLIADDYILPTSAFGAILCTVILWIGTFRYSAFDASASRLFGQIYDLLNVGIIIFSEHQKVIYANPFANKLADVHKLENIDISKLFDISEEKIKNYFKQVYTDETCEFTTKTNRTKRDCAGQLSIVYDKYRAPYCYIMVLTDVTKEMNAVEALKQANAAKSNFLTSMSHEIRTPINAVLGMNEMILRESNSEAISGYASNIESSGKLLLSIINDILDFSKIESGKMELFNSNYELAGMINDIYVMAGQKAKEKNLDLHITVNPDMPSWLYGDEVRMNQVIINVLNNAIKYTDEGFVSLALDYREIDSKNIDMLISVRDTGRGIKNVDTKELFQSFTRVDEKKNRSIEGTGLGLSIIKGFLDLMGGQVEVKSIYGVGSRFDISIPQKVGNETPIGSIEDKLFGGRSKQEKYSQSFVAPEVKVLAVDDVEINLMVIEELLKQTQVQLDMVTSGEAAIKNCRKVKYDIILMDHMMPGMDGIECLKRIRQDEGLNQKTPIIVLTANAVVGMRDMYLSEGFDDYIAKPVDGKKLEEMIVKYLP